MRPITVSSATPVRQTEQDGLIAKQANTGRFPMALPTHILLTYGYLLLFAWVLVEQFGIPLPATPILLAAGALSAEGQISFWVALLVGLVASLVADSAWFL